MYNEVSNSWRADRQAEFHRKVRGQVVNGSNHFERRMKNYRHIFTKAAGRELFPGTINVKIDHSIKVREDFRIKGSEIDEPEQDLIFERCNINGIEAFRIRPLNLKTGSGGHGDDTLEIACSQQVPCIEVGTEVEIELFRE